ncbi:chorismate mutase [Candidatus Saccharibacteria bacterium]|nr:chorismate mutase [Candidatus Saccharibacteria bacterium]
MNSDDTTQKLDDVRELIDSVDRELVMLLKQRSRLVELVTDIKNKTGQTAYQPERFAVLVDQLQEIAKEEGLDPALVVEVWDAIHESSQRQQNAVLRNK